MANSSILQQPHGTEERHGVTGPSTRASLEARRAAVLSYQQLVAGPVLSPTVARPPFSNQRMADAPRIFAENLARDPRAHPAAPARPEGAAKVVYEVVTEPVNARSFQSGKVDRARMGRKFNGPLVQPVELLAEPRHRAPLHGTVTVPGRSRLSPLQRAALRQSESRHDIDPKPAYITYTVNVWAAN